MCTRINGARGGLLACSILLMVVAAACVAGGVVLILGRAAYGDSLQFLRDDLAASAFQISGNKNLDVSALDVTFITLPLGIALLIFGALIASVCILGIIAASGRFYKFVIVYMALLSALFFIQVVVIICTYIDRRPFDSTVKRLLKASLKDFKDINAEDSFTLGWNAVMSYKKCCGVDSYADFSVAGYPKIVNPGSVQAETPQICCIDKTKANTTSCYTTKTYWNYGCYDLMWEYVTSETGLIIFSVFFIMLLEFLCLFFALWIVCYRKSTGPSKVGNYD